MKRVSHRKLRRTQSSSALGSANPLRPRRSILSGSIALLAASALALTLGSAPTASAVDGTWNVNANGNWSTTTNWVGGIVPGGIGSTASIIQNITATRVITLDINPTIGTLILGDTNNTSAFTIGLTPGAGTLTFDNGGIGALLNHNSATVGLSPSNSDLINSNVTIADTMGITIDADRNIEFRGAWNGGGFNVNLTNSGRTYWNANSVANLGVLSNVATLNIKNGEARFDGIAGTVGSNLIGAATINLGDGLVTTGGTGFRAFPRLFLVNTETTQTATLNLNGGWLTSDLGTIDNQTIWSGNIVVTGLAATNIVDVNDAGVADTHIISGTISGTGGFSKVNNGTLELTANNTLQGNLFVQRGGVGGAGLVSEGAVALTGATGALSGINSVVLSRDGSLYLDNSVTVNNNRFNDVGGIQLRAQGRLRMIGNSVSATSETMGGIFQETGSGKINFDLDDTTPQLTSLTFSSYIRNSGTITQFQVLDNTPGAFGSYTSGNARLFIADAGITGNLKGGGGLNGSTNKTIVVGAMGGVNNISNHFMTFDTTATTEMRPLKWDGTQAGSEYFLSRDSLTPTHQFTRAGLGSVDKNVNINFNTAVDGDVPSGLGGGYGWYGNAPIAILENVAMNSLRFGTNTPTVGNNSNEIGSALVLAPGARLYLGNKAADAQIGAISSSGSGMILFGRDVDGTAPGSNQYIAGGVLDFGFREAIIVNESGNNAFIRSNISGSGGFTKAGVNNVYLDNSNSYSGITTIAEGLLLVRDQNALGASPRVNIEGSGQLYLELGTNVINSTVSSTPPNLFVGINDASRLVLYSNNSNNTWGGDVIIDTVDNLGNWVFTPRIGTGALATLNINGNVYGNELLNPINTDTALNDARLISTESTSLSGGVINFNGFFRDNSGGSIGATVTADNENQVLRFQMRGSNELVVNARQQWDSAGNILLEQGILRYEGDGNFWTTGAAAAITPTNSQSGFRMSGSGSGTGSGSNNTTLNNAFILTKAGQALNIDRIDIGGDGTNNFNGLGNVMLAATNTSGTVTFGNGNERIFFGNASAGNAYTRDLTVYAAEGGTVDLNFWLDDGGANVSSWLTKSGRGTVNYNGRSGTQAADIEGVYLSGGLLRLSNYTVGTGVRFLNGAKTIFGGGGLEMDGASGANKTENFTGDVTISPGGTDVIVTSAPSRTTTLNIGLAANAFTRSSGGTLAFVENVNGGTGANITFNGTGAPADAALIPFATYGTGTGTAFATDFAMRADAAGNIATFAGATRENTDAAATWTNANDVSEGAAGFSGTTAAAAAVNSIHFDFNGANTLTLDAGGLTVTSGGVMVSSGVSTSTSAKTIAGGPIAAGGGNDLIVHQYGAAPLTISSIINGNALVKTGPGELILSGANGYTGRTYFNGGTISITDATQLGVVPGGVVADQLYFNGGALKATGDATLSANQGITLGGNGGEFNVADTKTLTVDGILAAEGNPFGYAANPAVGRVDKTGTGTLLLTNINNTFSGLLDVRAGTLKWEPTTTASATVTPFGSNSAFLDATTVRSGATLAIHPSTPSNTSNLTFTFQEWFNFQGGSTLDINPVNSVGSPHDFNTNLRGILKFDSLRNAGTSDGFVTPTSLAGATVIINRDNVSLNDAGGYITGDGGITKSGGGQLNFRENSPEWTGQLVILEGTVTAQSAGNPLGKGTLPIILGHNLLAEQAGEVVSGNNTAALLFQDEGFYRDVSTITQNIIVRADDGAGAQTKRIGAQFMANIDEVNYAGTLTLRDDVQFYYRDDARNSAGPTSTDVSNSTRSVGTLTNQETVFINFDGNIIGAAGNDITTFVDQAGNANVINGSITGLNDDLVIRAIFALNGNNSGWAGNLTLGNTVSDVDTQHIVTIGNPLGLTANNNVTMLSNATLRTSGNNIVIGNLSGSGTTENFIENSSAVTPGSITITQTADATVDAVIRNGETVFILQPGESYQALSIVKAGPAALTLTKGNSFTGTTTLAGGTLRLAYDADNSMLANGAALIMNDGILDLAGTVAHSELVGSTTINGTVAIERSTGTSIINLETITRNAGSLRIGADDIATTDNVNVNNILGGWATVGGSFATNSGVLGTGGFGNYIRGLATFDQNVDRQLGGAGTQVISNVATNNVNIVEDGAVANAITLAVAGGTTNIYTLRQGAAGGTAVVNIGAGNTLRLASGGILLPDGSGALTFNPTGMLTAGTGVSAATLFIQNQDTSASKFLTVGAVIADNGAGAVDVRTTGPGTTIFTGTNTYTGETLVGSGNLSIGDGTTSGTIGGTADVKVEASGILAFNRSDALGIANALKGNGNVVQFGTGTTTLSAASALSGLSFTVAAGTLATSVDAAINTTGNLTFGASSGATAVGAMTLGGNATVGGLSVQTNSATANTLTIAAGKTLTTNGDVTIGTNTSLATAPDQSKLTVSGTGAWVVNKPSGTFQVGGATTANNGTNTALDMSGLSTFTANLGTAGVFRVGDSSSSGSGSGTTPSTVTLAGTSTINAGLIGIGDRKGASGGTDTLRLGSVANFLNADKIAIGDNNTAQRGSGVLLFDTGTGTLQVRGSDGIGRANMDVVNSTSGTGASLVGTVNLTGHSSDVLLNALTVGLRSGATGAATSTFSFDTGTLDVTSVVLGHKTGGNGTATISGTLNIGGGTVAIGIGGVSMGRATGTLASTGSGTMNLTGGTITTAGDFTRFGATGTGISLATFNLDGASLNMQTHNIGDATNALTTTTFASGSLSNVGEINGGGTLDKTTGGTLILEGTNSYTGPTVITAGILQVGSGGATGTLGTNTGAIANDGTLALNRSNALTVANAITGIGGVSQIGGGTSTLSGNSSFTGPTVVSAGTLNLTGSIGAGISGGTSALNLSGGTLLLSGAGGEQVNNSAAVNLAGGKLALNNAANQFETVGAMTLSVNSTLDFGASGGNDTLFFAGVGAHTGGTILTIDNWVGNIAGGIDGTDDRLLFTGLTSDFTGAFAQADVSFTGFGSGYSAIQFGGNYEIVPVPEPSSTALLGAAGLLALVGYRERRRKLSHAAASTGSK